MSHTLQAHVWGALISIKHAVGINRWKYYPDYLKRRNIKKPSPSYYSTRGIKLYIKLSLFHTPASKRYIDSYLLNMIRVTGPLTNPSPSGPEAPCLVYSPYTRCAELPPPISQRKIFQKNKNIKRIGSDTFARTGVFVYSTRFPFLTSVGVENYSVILLQCLGLKGFA